MGEGANQLEAGSRTCRRPLPIQSWRSPASDLSLVPPRGFPLLARQDLAGLLLKPARGHGNFEIGYAKLVECMRLGQRLPPGYYHSVVGSCVLDCSNDYAMVKFVRINIYWSRQATGQHRFLPRAEVAASGKSLHTILLILSYSSNSSTASILESTS